MQNTRFFKNNKALGAILTLIFTLSSYAVFLAILVGAIRKKR